MERFKFYVEREKREEFYRTLKNYFSNYYREVEFSDCISTIDLSNFTLDDFQCDTHCLKALKKTLLTIEEFDDYILITPSTKSSLLILERLNSDVKVFMGA